MTTSTKLSEAHSFVIDMDGVLYRANTPIRGAREFLEHLRQTGFPFILLTNNSAYTVKQYVDKLARMGIEVDQERILTSGQAAAMYLAQIASPGTPVFMIGEDGVRQELEERGFLLRDDADVEYVVAGFDRTFTYAKLATAALAIQAGAMFIGTNPDKTFPWEQGLMPGNGAILAALQTATDVAPLIIGKPQPAIFELALDRLGATPEATAMIGDRLDTDILGACQLGITTILVLSGVTDAQQLARSTIKPDLAYEDIRALHLAWREVVAAQH